MNTTVVFVGFATLLVAALLAPHLEDPPRARPVLVLALLIALVVWTVVAVAETWT